MLNIEYYMHAVGSQLTDDRSYQSHKMIINKIVNCRLLSIVECVMIHDLKITIQSLKHCVQRTANSEPCRLRVASRFRHFYYSFVLCKFFYFK